MRGFALIPVPVALLLGTSAVVGQARPGADPAWLTAPLAPDEAVVVYLYHSGWVVRTPNHLLIFDPVPAPGHEVLDPVGIEPEALRGRGAVILVSHAHDDHWYPSFVARAARDAGMPCVLGWELDSAATCLQLGSKRTVTRVSGLEIYNVHHAFDGIPESAFLVHADDVWVYHAGDHSHSRGARNATFRDNLTYLAGIADRLDIMFTPTWGGELFAIETLHPRVVFPMHDGGHERQYARWAARPDVAALRVRVGVAERPGQCFRVRAGRVDPCP
jgi:L-ascorbate metabolism protein UlaG (beta-lactamase superfamily)